MIVFGPAFLAFFGLNLEQSKSKMAMTHPNDTPTWQSNPKDWKNIENFQF
jgi:hypothetical protein